MGLEKSFPLITTLQMNITLTVLIIRRYTNVLFTYYILYLLKSPLQSLWALSRVWKGVFLWTYITATDFTF